MRVGQVGVGHLNQAGDKHPTKTCKKLKLSPVSTARVHGPSSRAELTVQSGAFFDTRQLGPSSRVSKMHPSLRDEFSAREFSARELGPWTRVVEPTFSWSDVR